MTTYPTIERVTARKRSQGIGAEDNAPGASQRETSTRAATRRPFSQWPLNERLCRPKQAPQALSEGGKGRSVPSEGQHNLRKQMMARPSRTSLTSSLVAAGLSAGAPATSSPTASAAAHRDLVDPRLLDRSITDIAFSWAFNDAAHFSRSFAKAYGVAPSAVRAAHIRSAPHPRSGAAQGAGGPR